MTTGPAAHSCEAGSGVQGQAVDPYATLGQLSIAPATQTTVVTTTTRTITSYPPLLLNAPRNLSERDSREYPLARAPAPQSIKRFRFPLGDAQACFEETNDVATSVQKVC